MKKIGIVLLKILLGLIETILILVIVINILLISLLTAFTLKLSLNMIKCIIKKKEVNMRLYFNKYLYIMILFIFLITITSLYESFIAPFILKGLINIII